jgi:hypothetical protein
MWTDKCTVHPSCSAMFVERDHAQSYKCFIYTGYCSCLSCCDAERTKPVLCSTMAACNAHLFGQHVLLLRQCVLVRCSVTSSISCSARSSTSTRADCVTACAASSACSVFAVYVVDQLPQWSLLLLRHQLKLVHEVNELPHTAQRSTASSSVRRHATSDRKQQRRSRGAISAGALMTCLKHVLRCVAACISCHIQAACKHNSRSVTHRR